MFKFQQKYSSQIKIQYSLSMTLVQIGLPPQTETHVVYKGGDFHSHDTSVRNNIAIGWVVKILKF